MTDLQGIPFNDGAIATRVCQLYAELRQQLAGYRAQQSELAQRYAVHRHQPTTYSFETRAAVEGCGSECSEDIAYAWTSGTTREPKKILYPTSRLRALQEHYVDQLLLAADAAGVRRPTFYFLSNFGEDRSVSGLLAQTPPNSTLARELLRPSFVLRSVALSLAQHYSGAALHWAMLLMVRPNVIAAVNPSSLCGLLKRAAEGWSEIGDEVLRILEEPVIQNAAQQLHPEIEARRHDTASWLKRKESPSLEELLPDLALVYCWQGGYVRPFLEQLQQQLTALTPTLSPMFSLSTETVAYSIYPQATPRGGLPVYPGIYYEFLSLDAEARAENLISPWQLREGDEYRLVVSDAYGLVRYDTQDVFLCQGHVGDAPQLEFRRRHGLTYSFTGEKLTDLHLLEAYTEVLRLLDMPAATFTCFPSSAAGSLPGYVFVLLTAVPARDTAAVALELDEILCRINCEYGEKRASRRLASPRLICMSHDELAARVAATSPRYAGASPAQFKLLPLYTELWERIVPPSGEPCDDRQ